MMGSWSNEAENKTGGVTPTAPTRGHVLIVEDDRNLLELYTEITSTHPDAPEAGYSRSQLQSIVKSVVPKPELLSAQVELALTYLQRAEPRKEPPLRSGAPQESSDEALDHA